MEIVVYISDGKNIDKDKTVFIQIIILHLQIYCT